VLVTELAAEIEGFGRRGQGPDRVASAEQIGLSAREAAADPPEQAIAAWRQHFPEFWPQRNRFAGALTGINPGDVALLDLAIGGGAKLSTGVFVLYADAESFTLMTPHGHQFAGWITFSAERDGDTTKVQAQVLMRANDPLYELGMPVMQRKEDKFWIATLTALGQRLGVQDPGVTVTKTCVDARRQWRHAGNVWHNSMVRSVLQTVTPRMKNQPSG
jgi:hypothetical protein